MDVSAVNDTVCVRIYAPDSDAWVIDRHGDMQFVLDSQKATEWSSVRQAKEYLIEHRGDWDEPLEFHIETFKAVDLDDLEDDEHYITVEGDGWAIQHAFECRPNLTQCEVHRTMLVDQYDLGEHVEDEMRFNSHVTALDEGMYRVELGDEMVIFKEKVR